MKKKRIVSGQTLKSEEGFTEMQKIGFVIRELRFNFDLLTQKELADRCGVHFNTIQAIEHGDKNYNLMSLLKIISYFEYDLSTLVKDFF